MSRRRLPLNEIAIRAEQAQRVMAGGHGPAATANNALPAVRNGLADAVGYSSRNLPGMPGFSQQISQPDTIFKNLRWYLVSNMQQVLSQSYVEIGLVQTIVDIPVDDALRGGVEIKSKQLDEHQIEQLSLKIEDSGDLRMIAQGAKWSRLYGGGGLIILVGDQDPEEPLDVSAITEESRVRFRAADLWELFSNHNDVSDDEDLIDNVDRSDFQYFTFYGKRVHKSRVLLMKGLEAPSYVRQRLRGWGLSVMEILVRSINQYLKGTDLGFEVLDEFKIDIYKIKNLVNTLMQPGGDQAVMRRVQLANWQKDYQNAVVMDSEDDWDHKQLSFAGLAEAMAGVRMQVAADMRMPLSKLFGVSAAGFNSGEDDIEVYNGMVESQVRTHIKAAVREVAKIRCQELFGLVPDDLAISFKPLRVLSGEQEENVKTQKFNRLIQALERGSITELEFRDACNKGNLFDIRLDTSEDFIGGSRVDPQLADVLAGKKADGSGGAPPPAAGGKKSSEDPPEAKNSTTGWIDTMRRCADMRLPPPLTPIEKAQRLLNSAAFDRAAYEAEGGDDWIDPRRAAFFENPDNVDAAIWERARQASREAFGAVKWQFVVFMYKKFGGQFT